MSVPFFITIPHSGEQIPPEADWLTALPETTLLCDVDRFVDRLYKPGLESHQIQSVTTPWHRYICDLNRLPEDVDRTTVASSVNPPGSHRRGFIWQITTTNVQLLKDPVPQKLYQRFVQEYFEPFHQQVREKYEGFGSRHRPVFHLDAHSMPSMGTSEHRDPGQRRPEICISDANGASCSKKYVELVIRSYKQVGFEVGYNWPYLGGRITETYGRPALRQHCLQVELRRDLYMNETTKELLEEASVLVSEKISKALGFILSGLNEIRDDL